MSQPKAQATNYQIVDFLDLEPSQFSFGKPKRNQYGGSFVPIKYNDQTLYVRYRPHHCPFGVNTNTTDMSTTAPNTYQNDQKITGYSTSISVTNEAYERKAQELDHFFIEQCVENSVLWGLGGSSEIPVDRNTIAGYDDKGDKGKWKRLLKFPYKKNKSTGEKEYLKFPPHMDFNIPIARNNECRDENGHMQQMALLKPRFFNSQGNLIQSVTSHNVSDVLPQHSTISVLAMWSTIALGEFGASLKPKVHQVRIFPNETMVTDECLLEDEEEQITPELVEAVA